MVAAVAVGERRNWFAEERERFTVALTGQMVVVLASCGAAGGGEAGGGSGWCLERRGERGKEKLQKQG